MTARFLTELNLRAGPTDGAEWVVVTPLVYESVVAARVIEVPAGFQTDLTSVPRLPLMYLLTGGTATKAAVVHDYLYVTRLVDRATADAVFREAAEVSNVPAWRRWLMWAGVRAGGWIYWRKEKPPQSPPETAQDTYFG